MIDYLIAGIIGFAIGCIVGIKGRRNKNLTTEDAVKFLKDKGYDIRLYAREVK